MKAYRFKVGDSVLVGPHKAPRKIAHLLADVEGGYALDEPVSDTRYWNEDEMQSASKVYCLCVACGAEGEMRKGTRNGDLSYVDPLGWVSFSGEGLDKVFKLAFPDLPPNKEIRSVYIPPLKLRICASCFTRIKIST